MKKNTRFIVAILMLIPCLSFSQGKQRTLTHKGKKMVWNTKPFELEVVDPKTGLSSLKTMDERSTLFSWDGQEVVYEVPKSIHKTIENHLEKCVKKNKLERLLFNGRELKIHFQNYVINTDGELVFYEVLFFPYRQSVQLYPNEYTPEIKNYLQAIETCLKDMEAFENQKRAIYVQKVIEL